MNKILVLSIAIFVVVSCHHSANQSYDKARRYHLRFNPPDSSTYHYNTICETIITITENERTFGTRRTARFSVNYLISKDSNEVMMEMTFDGIDYHEKNDFVSQEADIADVPGPVRDLLNRMKRATIYVRVRPVGQVVTISGFQELVNTAMDAYFAEADRPQARTYWGQWVDQELVWKNLDPFVWVTLDSARYLGDHWTDTSMSNEDINFKINRRFQFDTIAAATATIRSQGLIGNDSAGTWLSGKAVKGILTGNEVGRCLVDAATGMPGEMEDSISAEGNVQIDGHNARLEIIRTITMTGGKQK